MVVKAFAIIHGLFGRAARGTPIRDVTADLWYDDFCPINANQSINRFFTHADLNLFLKSRKYRK